MYVGRFAPSPTGALHAGSLVAALASWLDARAHAGQWLLRIEDVDTPRCVPGADRQIVQQLAACGLRPDQPPVWQSQRGALYARALARLVEAGRAYPCACQMRCHTCRRAAPMPWRENTAPSPAAARAGGMGCHAPPWRRATAKLKL